MEIFALGLIFFLSFFFVLIFRTIDNLRFWENKEYRFERIISHIYWDLDYNHKGINLVTAKFIIFAVVLTFTLSIASSAIAIIVIYTLWIIELFNYLNKYFQNRSLGVNLSVRNMLILGLYIIVLVGIFFIVALAFSIIPHPENPITNISQYISSSTENINVYPDALILLVILSVIGLTLDILTPMITGVLVFLTSPIGRLSKLMNIYLLKSKLSRTNIKLVGVTGSFGKSTLINYIERILEDRDDVVVINQDFTSIASLSNEISENINYSTKYIFFEFEGYTLGEIKEIVNSTKPDVIALTDIGFNHITSFKSHQEFLNSFKEIDSEEPTIISNVENKYNRAVIEKLQNKVIKIQIEESRRNFKFKEKTIRAIDLTNQKYKRYTLEIFAALGILKDELMAKISNTDIQINNIEEIQGDNDSIIIVDSLENSDVNGLINLVSTPPSSGNENLKILVTDGFNELGKLKSKVLKTSVAKLAKHVDSIITTDYQLHKIALENNLVSHYFTGIDKLLVFTRSILTKNLTIYVEGELKEPMVNTLRKQD